MSGREGDGAKGRWGGVQTTARLHDGSTARLQGCTIALHEGANHGGETFHNKIQIHKKG